MASTIVTKNSSTASAVPLTGDLTQGELAVNVTDKRLFTKDSGGTVVELGINPSSLTVKTTLKLSGSTSGFVALQGAAAAGSTTYTLPSADGTSGQALTTNGSGTLSWATIAASAATATVLGTVYGKMTTSGASPYLTALGYNAGVSTTGASNTAIGTQALFTNTTGTNNTAVGYQAVYSNSTGAYNSAFGQEALKNTTASNNTAVGFQALFTNSSGASNVAMGVYAGYYNTTGNYNVFVGSRSTFYNSGAGQANTTGSSNSAFGAAALGSNTTGSSNVAIGTEALVANTTASYNTSVGYQAGYSITTGAGNVCMGYTAGYNLTTGSYGVYIGIGAQPSAGGNISEIVIGSGAGGSNITGKGTTTGYINPQGGGVYQGNNSTLWSVTSDQRLKKNIVDNNDGLEKLIQVKIRNYEYRLPEEVDSELKPSDAIQKSGVQVGVIAQELQQVFPDCVKQESTGVLALHSDNLIWYMINAIKQLKAELDAAKAEIATLKGN